VQLGVLHRNKWLDAKEGHEALHKRRCCRFSHMGPATTAAATTLIKVEIEMCHCRYRIRTNLL
jgi:hypothetical protein